MAQTRCHVSGTSGDCFCDEGRSCKWVVCICRFPADLRCTDAVVWEAGVPAATALPPPDKMEALVAGW